MSAPHGPSSHPRRRPLKVPGTQLSTHGMQLRKSGTFSSPKSLTSDVCDLDNSPFMPRRSPTNVDNLEALVDPCVQRVVDLIKDFDKKLGGDEAPSSVADILTDQEVLPVPSFVLDNATLDSEPMDIDSKKPTNDPAHNHDHASDSGLGSSIAESKYDVARTRKASLRESISSSVAAAHSTVTHSVSALGASEEKHVLGEFACKQIHDCIIKPILDDPNLKDFHSLIKDVPRRIGQKNICNLRDLEKTLIFLAPELSATPKSYQQFCERSIQLLHATVDCLSDQDQRLPSDRPYTNNYFLDLLEQIRRYAAIMAATRQKESHGEDLDEMDYSRDEKITLRGGLSNNGRPLELVREKDGKFMPISDEVEDAYRSKRTLSDDEMDDDEALRSMARRRKSDRPGDVMHLCRDCNKEFKRPCDLTKHEKTHSRPWKCIDEKCKYFELGWPTEKERDRHMNDKHSKNPGQYKCYFTPCPYASKRESNCKQHMEKAHGWEYVRSKSNGRRKAPAASDRSTSTPLTPFLDTPVSVILATPVSANLTTPITPFIPSPQVAMDDNFDFYNHMTSPFNFQGVQTEVRRDSAGTDMSHLTYSSGNSPVEPTSFVDAVTPEDATIDHNFNLFNCGPGTTLNTAFQPLTPALSTQFETEQIPFFMNSDMVTNPTHLSPLAQPDVTLFSPQMQIDDGIDDAEANMEPFMPTGDFTLYDNPQSNNMTIDSSADWFPSIDDFGGAYDPFYNTELPKYDA